MTRVKLFTIINKGEHPFFHREGMDPEESEQNTNKESFIRYIFRIFLLIIFFPIVLLLWTFNSIFKAAGEAKFQEKKNW